MHAKQLTTRVSVIMTMMLGLFGTAAVAMPSAAFATCSTSPNLTGIYYYTNINCGSYLDKINADVEIDSLADYAPGWNNSISSVDESPQIGDERWRLYMYNAIDLSGASIGLSNASTTASKFWNMTELGFNDEASSLIQTYSD